MLPLNIRPLGRDVLSYVPDIIFMAILIVAGGMMDLFAPPFERKAYFALTYRHPAFLLEFIAWIGPLALVSLVVLARTRDMRQVFIAGLGLMMACALTVLTTDIGKVLSGRPRPDFLDRCQPDPSQSQVVCTGDKSLVREGRMSFPSGHSSNSFAGLGYLAFILCGQLGAFTRKGFAVKVIAAYIPFASAFMVALSRVSDYRHHWQDGISLVDNSVLVGGIIGTFFAYFSYRQYFPSLSSRLSPDADDSRSFVDDQKDGDESSNV